MNKDAQIVRLAVAAQSHSMIVCGEPIEGFEPDWEEGDIATFVAEDQNRAISAVADYLENTI